MEYLADACIRQLGSLVNFERLRFDLHCPRAVKTAQRNVSLGIQVAIYQDGISFAGFE
ncbi:hypothetical protein [Prochlorococcus marinus]|uniref:hypothetical protein n=1 Tax=Prochlorococcus TaxID=1218 RepID=UPI000AA7A8B0|nr:hypothetical protein [Prochlorococcus marinus]